MIEGINTVIHGNFLDNNLPDKCANLIIADPPYFEVKGDFDFVWGSFEDYLKDVEKWAIECKRVLADNGTLFWWGMDRKIAYAQIILDKYFYLIGTPVWEKPSNPNEWDTRRTFPERGAERLLMYSNEKDVTGLEQIIEDFIWAKNPFGIAIKEARAIQMIKRRDFANAILINGYKNIDSAMAQISNWELGKNIPTLKDWQTIKDLLKIRKEYEDLRQEFEYKRRCFKNEFGLTDIMRFARENNNYEHDTKKPEKLTRALILTCSRKGDLVVVPFAGSGTECAMAIKEGRKCIGYDVEKKYADMSNERIKAFKSQPQLF
jgi:DNA modification methylase